MAQPVPATRNRFVTAPFAISVVLLAAVAVGLPWANDVMKLALTKLPIPLRSPLYRLDRHRLGPYKFRAKIDLEQAVVETLGTEQYIYWILEDTSYKGRDPRRYARLFVSYYTGEPDAVPHTPDVCMLGSGYTIENADNMTIRIPELVQDQTVPVRAVTFVKSGIFSEESMTVVYTFRTNDVFAATRQAVRLKLSNLTDRYAYYSKVEVIFGAADCNPVYPTPEQTRDAAQKLLSYVLPVLVEDHWPDDWSVANSSDAPRTGVPETESARTERSTEK